MVDSLDTMFLMGLHDEFERGVKLVNNMTFVKNTVRHSLFCHHSLN